MKTVITFILACMATATLAQDIIKGRTYRAQADFTASEYFETCTTRRFGICDGTRFEVIGFTPDSSKVIIKIKKGYTCSLVSGNDTLPYALEGKQYCISRARWNNDIRKSSVQLASGPLVVPFKFQTKDFKIYSAGEIGFYVGPKFTSKKSPDNYLSVIFSAGYSKVPLNDVNAKNAEDTRTVDAASVAGGAVYNFGKDFQIGLLAGGDFFNADDKARSRSWISFTIGINLIGITKKSEKKNEVRMAQ
ncbi:MAG TPA: hypothetical protein PKL56_01825 [Cyclobacteriaceae bacterium]|nr:hypothetical protein [Cyclobacteriaceae bacterium]HMV10963.1 hypothetical protein [Cyclobacteriaceae bacterium]HMV89147.1 hypothetical protein [Cyclobacteriaceae bacterium]HMX00018.1 hypothetical protein [Cyclobacteriaceae bacterium]HMX49120.1 hypothetical protein [Cyclobacteriaceae bacterium]